MSAQALQRVVVRMLHDPDVERACAGAELSATERGWIEAVDPRRWRADPLRRYRVLQALIEEYPVSAARVVRGPGAPTFDAFFEGRWFHQTVQQRGVLAHAFGAWLGTLEEAAPFAAIEAAIARVRRVPSVRHAADRRARWRAAPWIAWGQGPLAAWEAARARLHDHPGGPVAAALDLKLRLRPGPLTEVHWLVDGAGSPRVEEPPEALVAFLDACRAPLHWVGLRAAIEAAGAEPEDADDLIEGFIDDVLLTLDAD